MRNFFRSSCSAPEELEPKELEDHLKSNRGMIIVYVLHPQLYTCYEQASKLAFTSMQYLHNHENIEMCNDIKIAIILVKFYFACL